MTIFYLPLFEPLRSFGLNGNEVLEAPFFAGIFKDRTMVMANVRTVKPNDHVIGILYRSISIIFVPMNTKMIANP
jgi:hypothetical protein